jgi:fumarate hydratase subunit alpha
MRSLHVDKISESVAQQCIDACNNLGDDVITALKNARGKERSPNGRSILDDLIKNAELCNNKSVPLCQDTGLTVLFVRLGQELRIEGGSLYEALNAGVRKGYEEGYLRKSTCEPFTRKNMGDNTPAIIHLELVEGDKLEITMMAKGGGCENMSRVTMLRPSDGKPGIVDYVVQRCLEASGSPCPPIVIGIGIGGTYERSAILSKKALLRRLDVTNPDTELAELEAEIMEKVNATGMGPMGLGGDTYTIGVSILKEPCHIASLPLAVNIDCHSHRHKDIVL